MPLLLAFLGHEQPAFTQTSAGDFIKAIITISANASQNEQSCIGPNSLTRQLVSETCIEGLIADMLKGGNPLTVGVGIIIEVIRKNNSDYDPEIQAGQELPPSTSDPIYLGTLLRFFAKHVPDFMDLILSPNHTIADETGTKTVKRQELQVAFGNSIEPLGFDRFKTCELMAELLHCSNMGLLNERGSEAYIQQRDKEREKLRAEGAFTRVREPQSAITEFSEDGASFNNEKSPLGISSDSPEGTRRLGVTNSADDDGFEEVGASGDLSDDIKEDFDDKEGFEIESGSVDLIRPSKSRLSLDDEFFDEPLTSPSLRPADAGVKQAQSDEKTSEEKADLPSPTGALTSEIRGLELKQDSNMANTEDSGHTDAPTTDELVAEITQQLSPTRTTAEAPPLPARNQGLGVETEDANTGLSPHEEDKPAPLFSSRSDESSNPRSQNAAQSTGQTEQTQEAPSAPYIEVSTWTLAGHDSHAMDIHDGQQPYIQPVENDVDGRPIVGDYLKVMFVEHRVVPTILVCSSLELPSTCADI